MYCADNIWWKIENTRARDLAGMATAACEIAKKLCLYTLKKSIVGNVCIFFIKLVDIISSVAEILHLVGTSMYEISNLDNDLPIS